METSPLPVPLSYAAAPKRGRSLAWSYQLLLSTVVVVSLGVFLGSLFVVPLFVSILKDFKTDVPMLTKGFMQFYWWLDAAGWGWCLAVLFAMAIVVAGIVIDATATEVRPIRRYAITMTILLLLADVLWAGLVVIAMFLPMFTLLQSASGSKR